MNKFEGKERDSETGNDDFGARYYSNHFGRWLSSDWSAVPTPVPYANLTNPQTLNLYGMVSDNPETFADLDGHFWSPFDWYTDKDKQPQPSTTTNNLNVIDGAEAYRLSHQGPPCLCSTLGGVIHVITDIGEVAEDAGEVAGALALAPYVAVVGAATLLYTPPMASAKVDDAPIAKEGSGPKAADAPGVTAGGQATDRYGNKIGPSGKPQVDEVRHSTEKGAKDAARQEGKSTPVKHPTPTRGKGHYHATDEEGEKLPSSTHHVYPE